MKSDEEKQKSIDKRAEKIKTKSDEEKHLSRLKSLDTWNKKSEKEKKLIKQKEYVTKNARPEEEKVLTKLRMRNAKINRSDEDKSISRAKRLKHSPKYDFITPNGYIVLNLSVRDYCILFNLPHESARASLKTRRGYRKHFRLDIINKFNL